MLCISTIISETIVDGDLEECNKEIKWALDTGRFKEEGPKWYRYPDMEVVWGVPIYDATFEDFQRIFKCLNIKETKCNQKGLGFPQTCSKPPCDTCNKSKLLTHTYFLTAS